jgi:SAM-dependent methyltransferase
VTQQQDQIPLELNTNVAHPARVYDYWLGGKDNFPADRAVAEAVIAEMPEIRLIARENRAFLQRTVRFLAGEAGVRQFLDVGTGIPTQGNVHEVAQQVAPDARVVYVDNDPIVHVHGNALLAGSSSVIVMADLREPDAVLQHPRVREAIDFDRPVAVLLLAVLHLIPDEGDPAGIVARLRDALAPGSYLVLSHGTADINPEVTRRAVERFAANRGSYPYVHRSHAEIMRFFDGFELVGPGLVQIPLWRPDGDVPGYLDRINGYGGVGRKR